MLKIKFAHNYSKLAIQTDCAKLIQVFVCDYKDLSKDFIEYDTWYWEHGKTGFYKLPKTKLLILLFTDDEREGYLFTTVRKWTKEKEKYYRSMQGKYFGVEVKK